MTPAKYDHGGKLKIDNVIFNYVVRAGKAHFGDVFYDINLEVDSILPHVKDASEINESTSNNTKIAQNSPSVKNNFMQSSDGRLGTLFSILERIAGERIPKYAVALDKERFNHGDGSAGRNRPREPSPWLSVHKKCEAEISASHFCLI